MLCVLRYWRIQTSICIDRGYYQGCYKGGVTKGRVKKGEVYNAIVVRTSKGVRRNDGSLIKFDNNAAVLLNAKLEPIGTFLVPLHES